MHGVGGYHVLLKFVVESVETAGAEVQKGMPSEERKIETFFVIMGM